MRSLIAASLFISADAVSTEEHSLMQGLVARRGQLTPEASTKEARMDNTAKLMETATKMMKNGATPDVITFIESTITEVNQNVLSVIVDEHNEDQQIINELLARFDAAVAKMTECAASVQQQHTDMLGANTEHQYCRSDESIKCARSRKCEGELEEFWRVVKHEERLMREFHDTIYSQWCPETGAPPQPDLNDPFYWSPVEEKEGPETSLTVGPYPGIDNEHVVGFRTFSVTQFGYYIEQEYVVELAWHNYNTKIVECAALEEDWTLKTETCDHLQTTFHDQACAHHNTNRDCAADFGRDYHLTQIAYDNAVIDIRQKEFDRKREWETLHIVTCLLETVYTHVIHSIDSGDPCPTTETHPEQTAAEINTCHIVEESMTANLTIDYGVPRCDAYPEECVLPPAVEPPCTEEFIHQTGTFSADIELTHGSTIVAEGLEAYFAAVSHFGWAGCAAPKACTPCEAEEQVVDPTYHECATCLRSQSHLHPGQMDRDTFKCLSGNECIRSSGRCNGVHQCADQSDELGCNTLWGLPAILGTMECQDSSHVCADGSGCIPKSAKCNGQANCADGSDELDCESEEFKTVETMTGFTATFETVQSEVFTDRSYEFTSLGSFTQQDFVKMSNEDKHIRRSHVQMKLRLEAPGIVYVAKLDNHPLEWLQAEGWTRTHLDGVTYMGNHEDLHEDWLVNHLNRDLVENVYGPGEVWQKAFAAGTVEMRGNGGGDGSYLVFVAHTSKPVQLAHLTMVDGCLNQNTEVPRAEVSANSGATASVRCCEESGASCDTEVNGVCHAEQTYDEATALCAGIGRRLCTEAEIIDRMCCGTGCGFDGHQVWVLSH